MDFWEWLRRQMPGGLLSSNGNGLLGGVSQPPVDPNRGQGMMAGVAGFHPADPGAFANRTAGDADMAGYGGSPRLPDASQANYGALINSGLRLMEMGEGGPAVQTWTPQASPIHQPQPMAMPSMAQIFQDPVEVELLQRQRRRVPMGLLR